MKKLTKLLFLIPLTITPTILTSCSTKKEIISSKKEIINSDRYIGEIKAHIDILIAKIQEKENNKTYQNNLKEAKKRIKDYFYDYSKPKTTNLGEYTNYEYILDELQKQINGKSNSELIEINIKLNDILSCL